VTEGPGIEKRNGPLNRFGFIGLYFAFHKESLRI
jgi:hypothetical protein